MSLSAGASCYTVSLHCVLIAPCLKAWVKATQTAIVIVIVIVTVTAVMESETVVMKVAGVVGIVEGGLAWYKVGVLVSSLRVLFIDVFTAGVAPTRTRGGARR